MKNVPKRVVVLLGVLLLVFFAAVLLLAERTSSTVRFENGVALSVEVVSTVEGRARGLSGHRPLTDQQGMLFVWSEEDTRSFWMKGMTFPIDIIWLRDGQVLGVTANLPVPTSNDPALLARYTSPGPVDQVLEVAAGWAEAHGLTAGAHFATIPPSH